MSESRHVLVADDDPNILRLVQVILTAEGMTVVTASDGDRAQELASTGDFDLIVLDVTMPGRDGLEVLKALKRDPCTEATPVILLTARARDSEIWHGWQVGADYYITKPFNVDELVHYTALCLAGPDDDQPVLTIG